MHFGQEKRLIVSTWLRNENSGMFTMYVLVGILITSQTGTSQPTCIFLHPVDHVDHLLKVFCRPGSSPDGLYVPPPAPSEGSTGRGCFLCVPRYVGCHSTLLTPSHSPAPPRHWCAPRTIGCLLRSPRVSSWQLLPLAGHSRSYPEENAALV